MNDYCGGLLEYLNEELGKRLGKRRPRAEIEEILEDPARSGEENVNTITLSTSKGLMVLEVTDQERREILDGKIKDPIITVTGSETSVLTVLLSNNGSLDYSG